MNLYIRYGKVDLAVAQYVAPPGGATATPPYLKMFP